MKPDEAQPRDDLLPTSQEEEAETPEARGIFEQPGLDFGDNDYQNWKRAAQKLLNEEAT